MNKNKIQVILVEPDKKAVVADIGAALEDMQATVGGFIEVIYPFDDAVAIICNEEGKINGLPLNRALYDDQREIYDVIAGTFFIAGCGGDGFISLSQEQIDRYKSMFLFPEKILKVNDKIVAIKYENY